MPGKVAGRLSHAWCITTHKSQGSQYRHVFFLCSEKDWHMMKNQLLYTAVSRAQKKCVVIGDVSGFKNGIRHRLHRNSVGKLLYTPSEIAYYEETRHANRGKTAGAAEDAVDHEIGVENLVGQE